MGPGVDLLPSSDKFPTQAEVVVIGGGIIGVATALSLAQRGIQTVLLEKGTVAAEQSSRNWGWCRRTGRDLRELPLIQESMKMWEAMNALVGSETGFRREGILYTSRTEEQRARHLRWVEEARNHDIHSEMISVAQVSEKLPGLQGSVVGGLWTPLDGRAEPQKATPAMAKYAMSLGVNLQQHCAVRTIEQSAGRMSHVVTEHGVVNCQSVVVAGGAWSRLLMQGMGIELPQLKVLSTVMRTRPVQSDITFCASFGNVALRKRLDGGLTIASSAINTADITPDSLRFIKSFFPAFWHERKSLQLRLGKQFVEEALRWQPGHADKISLYERIRVLEPRINPAVISQMLSSLRQWLPSLGKVQVAQSWGGLIDTMPDAIPVISGVATLPGLYLATGFSGHGFGIAPAAGQLMADLVTNATPVVDPSAFRLSRFSDGEKIQAQHWL